MNYAWYYNAGGGTYYWTESYNMSTSQFAREVSHLIDKCTSAADISAGTSAGFEALKKRASTLIYVP